MSILAMLAAAVLGSSAGPAVLSVDELEARHRELAGQKVIVRGWLSPCYVRDCGIASSMETYRDHRIGNFVSIGEGAFGPLGEWIFARHSSPTATLPDGRVLYVSMGAYSDVLLEATVTDQCWGDRNPDGTVSVCYDRAPQILPIRITRVFKTIPENEVRHANGVSNKMED